MATDKPLSISSFRRRMAPMYVGMFLRHLVLWYAIEKLFMVGIGYDNASIGVMVAVFSLISLLTEVPSGILADRWSRKGVLMIATLCLFLSGLIGGFSNDILTYIIAACLWGVYAALASGTDDAMIYDALIEERGHANDFKKEYGIYRAVGGIALVIANSTSGVLASSIGLREVYFLSLPGIAAAAIALLFYRDSRIQHESADTRLLQHTRRTFKVVFQDTPLVWIVLAILTLSIVETMIVEMQQLWLIALAAPVFLYGIAGAMLSAGWGMSGILTRFFNSTVLIRAGIVAALVCSVLLTISTNYIVVTIVQVALASTTSAIAIVKLSQLHDRLPSSIRASASSAVSSVVRLLVIPLVLLFGWLSHQMSVYTAAWILVVLIVLGLLSELLFQYQSTHRTSAA